MPTSRCLQEQGQDVEELDLGPSSSSVWLEHSWACLLGRDSVVGGGVLHLGAPGLEIP